MLQLDWGIKGAAIATVAAQGVSALGSMGYAYVKYPELRLHRNDCLLYTSDHNLLYSDREN